MVETRTIAFVAVLLVLAAFVAPYASPTGFATVSSCAGKPILALSPSTVQTGSIIVARVSGLENCEGQEVQLKKESCYTGESLASFVCRDSKCSNGAGFTIDSARQDYVIYACIDKANNNLYLNPGERAATGLKVVSLPDMRIKTLEVPRYAYANAPFDINVVLENKGVLAAGGVEYKVQIFRQGEEAFENNAIKTVTNTGTSVAFPNVLPGSEYKFKVPISLGKGNYLVKVIVDPTDVSNPNGRVLEWNENNNVLSLKFSVN